MLMILRFIKYLLEARSPLSSSYVCLFIPHSNSKKEYCFSLFTADENKDKRKVTTYVLTASDLQKLVSLLRSLAPYLRSLFNHYAQQSLKKSS